MRLDLCEEALRLGRVLAGLAPKQPEVHGLVALMEIQASRARARVGPDGGPVLLLDQDRARWDPLLVAARPRRPGTGRNARPRRLRPLHGAGRDRRLPRAGAERRGDRLGPDRGALRGARPAHPLPRGRAQPRRRGGNGVRADAGLELVDALAAAGELDGYHLLGSVRADLLAKLGRDAEARNEFERAAAMTENARDRDLLLARARIVGA